MNRQPLDPGDVQLLAQKLSDLRADPKFAILILGLRGYQQDVMGHLTSPDMPVDPGTLIDVTYHRGVLRGLDEIRRLFLRVEAAAAAQEPLEWFAD